MQQITVKLPDDTAESLDDTAELQYDGNRSDAIRDLLEKGLEADDRIAELEQEYDERITDLERMNERLRNEKRALINDREERTELREYVEDELSYREAGIGTRMKWWLFGKND